MNLKRSVFTLMICLSLAWFRAEADQKIQSSPRINGAKIYGARPGHPFLYAIPATGTRPVIYTARGLPQGLILNADTGIITGSVSQKGEYPVQLEVQNQQGTARRDFKIVIGDRISLTPPMGWSSWYSVHEKISAQFIRQQTDAMISSGLIQHGYNMINIDDGWNIKTGSTDPILGGQPRDAQGNLRSNKNFPDMKELVQYIHEKGLRAGIYSSPGPLTCGGYEGSYRHEEQDIRLFSDWGFDLLKYDWCSYKNIATDHSIDELQKPYLLMNALILKQDRDFIYNLCQYGKGKVWEWGRTVGGQFWRTTGDVGVAGNNLWAKMSQVGFSQGDKQRWNGPGGWNDPDNILIGKILWQNKLQPTPLTQDEQKTWVSLWSLLAAPLVFGGDMTQLDDFTLSLLTNDEVIDVNQDVLGKQATPVVIKDGTEIWVKDLEDGSKAVGLFNRSEKDQTITVRWKDLSIKGRKKVRDLWHGQDWGFFQGEFHVGVPRHGAELIRISK